jgi:hypothetical protein
MARRMTGKESKEKLINTRERRRSQVVWEIYTDKTWLGKETSSYDDCIRGRGGASSGRSKVTRGVGGWDIQDDGNSLNISIRRTDVEARL